MSNMRPPSTGAFYFQPHPEVHEEALQMTLEVHIQQFEIAPFFRDTRNALVQSKVMKKKKDPEVNSRT
jgi:hypothetical protein